MTPASTGKFTAARAAVILFSACMMGGFVWYSHVRAQPKNGATAVGESTPATILPGSKSTTMAVTAGDVGRVREDGTIDLSLDAAAGQSGTPAKAGDRMILPSSKLGVFRDIAGNSSTSSGTGDGKLVPMPASGNPPVQPARPVLFSGSKTFAGPVISTEQIGTITVGNGSKEASQLSLPDQNSADTPVPPSRVLMGGSKSLSTPAINSDGVKKLAEKGELPPVHFYGTDPWKKDAPIFSGSKSGPIFRPTPQPTAPPAPNPLLTPKPPPLSGLEQIKVDPQPQTSTPAPASP